MKMPPVFVRRRCGAARYGQFLALVLVVAACASSEPSVPEAVQLPGGADAPIPLAENPETFDGPGSPGSPGPAATPEDDADPGATETNVLVPPCSQDSDCGDGRRCVGTEPTPRDAGSDAASDAGDAGFPSDAPVRLGRCKPVDGG